MTPQPTRATQGISFELPILRAAKEHAASRRMSLSAYVNQLIFDDLNSQPAPMASNSVSVGEDGLNPVLKTTQPGERAPDSS